jgi:hypothetical protein
LNHLTTAIRQCRHRPRQREASTDRRIPREAWINDRLIRRIVDPRPIEKPLLLHFALQDITRDLEIAHGVELQKRPLHSRQRRRQRKREHDHRHRHLDQGKTAIRASPTQPDETGVQVYPPNTYSRRRPRFRLPTISTTKPIVVCCVRHHGIRR